MSKSMMIDIDMPPHSMSNDDQPHILTYAPSDINTGKTTISAPHADFSAMQYQALKQDAMIPGLLPPQPRYSPTSIQSVFVIDSKGSEQQQVEVPNPQPPIANHLSIIPENEQDILKDIEMDCLLYGNENEAAPMNVDQHPDEDLTIKIKQESNLFNPHLIHTEVIHPRRSSAEERASVLLSRAFAPISPELGRISNTSMNGFNMAGFGDSFSRVSQNLFAPIGDDFRMSDNLEMGMYGSNRNSIVDQNPIPFPNSSINSMNAHMNIMQLQTDLMSQRSSGHGNTSMQQSGTSSRTTGIRKCQGKRIRACAGCHKAKKRCVRPLEGGGCLACVKRGVICEDRRDGRTDNKGKAKKKTCENLIIK